MKSIKDKPSTPDLSGYSEAQLIAWASEIFAAVGPITEKQKEELAAIDSEFARRDSQSRSLTNQ